MSATVSISSFLLATVTSSIPAGGDFIHRSMDEMDKLIRNELGEDGTVTGSKRVIWEEKQRGLKTSILDKFLPSELTIDDILKMRYARKLGREQQIIYGGHLMEKLRSGALKWRLSTGAFTGSLKKPRNSRWDANADSQDHMSDVDEVDEDGDAMMETDVSWSQESYRAGQKRPNPGTKSTEEKNWERLFRSIYYIMRNLVTEATDSRQSNVGPKPKNPLPFSRLPEPRFWSSEYATTPMPDATDSRKPDLILMDYRWRSRKSGERSWEDVLTVIEITKSELVDGREKSIYLGITTKAYLILRGQPWRRFVILFSIANLQLRAHYLDRSGIIISKPLHIIRKAVRFIDVLNAMTLSDRPALGFDPTIHVCDTFCTATPHDGLLPDKAGAMPTGAIGWVIDDDSNVYWIMAVLWKSRGLFSRGTVCYRVRDNTNTEYALKDCWVDAESLEHEVEVLDQIRGVPNVVQLVKYWDVKYEGQPDCTSSIREYLGGCLPGAPVCQKKIHRRMLLTPCGLPLTTFKSLSELVDVFKDLVVAHETLVTERHVLHGDLSPNNIIIHEGKGYFIDFDHAKFLNKRRERDADSRGTGTIQYMSCRLLKMMGATEPAPTLFVHTASDDLESLFYIFLEFTITFGGPGPQMTGGGVQPDNAIRWRIAYASLDRHGLGTSGTLKKEFITDLNSRYKPAPYFEACHPILESWRLAMRAAIDNGGEVSHREIIDIITRGAKDIADPPLPSGPPSMSLPSLASLGPRRPGRNKQVSPPIPVRLSAPLLSSNAGASGSRPRQKRQMLPPSPSNALPPSPSASMSMAQEPGNLRRSSRKKQS
ncbi:hypothetical protein F4604DRAFT_1692459 [Suillus subluteus]|nr:hypothetical protein F4604DRAFT_1692459 [Suillus subluteus]